MVGRVYSLLSLGLVLVTLLAINFSSFHHHSDLADHPDCVVCDFSHQVNTTALINPALFVLVPPVLSAPPALPVLSAPLVRPSLLLPSRAPPAVTSSNS